MTFELLPLTFDLLLVTFCICPAIFDPFPFDKKLCVIYTILLNTNVYMH